ncbi:hypothetical protein [Duganella sp. BJB476]|nr:hypothetical protein [Duganella sp. BJB476]
MGAMDFVQMLLGSGVLVQGWAAARWVGRMESRVQALEAKAGAV